MSGVDVRAWDAGAEPDVERFGYDPERARVDREFSRLAAKKALDDAKDTDSALDRLRRAMNKDGDD